MRRLAFVCLKGGSSKTTSATAVAIGLARRGKRTLLIDADQQANATWTILEGQGATSPTLADVLMRRSSAVEAIRSTSRPGLDLLPASAELGGCNVALAQELARDTRLRSALAGIEGQYDHLIVDTGPAFSTVLANVLVAVEEVIVPVDPGVYALLGLAQLQETLAEVREAYGNDALRLAGVLLTKVQRNTVTRDIEAELRSRFGPLVFTATIPLSVKVEEACSRGTTVMDHAPKSAAAVAYSQIVEEILHDRTKKRSRVKAVGRSGEIDAA